MRSALIGALATALVSGFSGCGLLAVLGDSGPLFAADGEGEGFDFENQSIGRVPAGFVGAADHWHVADSPTAASGEQVLVYGGGEESSLEIEAGRSAKALRAEVSVRVFVGEPGAGVACGGGGENAHLVRVEPAAGRVAFYDRGESLVLVAEHPLAEAKGDWVRIGIRCTEGQVAAYVAGKRIGSRRVAAEPYSLRLHADAEVTAQFDDVRFRVN